MNIKEKDNEYIVASYKRFDLCLVSGKGSKVYDDKGNRYIDFGTGIAVNTFGVCDEEWQNAIKEQICKIQHTSNLYYSEPCVRLAELLCKKTGMKKVFFANSGAEANECAIKIARKYGTDINPDKNIIITLNNSFHGRTITTLSATGQEIFHKNFTPFTEGFIHIDANDCEQLKNAINDKVCAVMIEIVQGEGGVNTLNKDFLDEIEKITTENDILLIVDEVQTGNGRSGMLYSYMNFDMTPDVVSTAKGLAGGLPMGAVMTNDRTQNVLTYGTHGSTFGGNPICANAACNIIERIDDELLKSVREKSQYIIDRLNSIDGVKSVSGLGFMLGVETQMSASEVVHRCMDKGLLILTAKSKVRILPALNIGYDEIDEGLKILEEVLKGE